MTGPKPELGVEVLARFRAGELVALCEAAEAAIAADGGFGWVKPPSREAMERYWKGVVAVPDRTLVVARLDRVIAGSAQLVRPARNNEAQAHAAQLTTSFMAPWARGHGLARLLTLKVEEIARDEGFAQLELSVRASQTAAIALYGTLGYTLWGTHPAYAKVDGALIAGQFYTKALNREALPRS